MPPPMSSATIFTSCSALSNCLPGRGDTMATCGGGLMPAASIFGAAFSPSAATAASAGSALLTTRAMTSGR